MVIVTDFIGSYKSNYYTIKATTAPSYVNVNLFFDDCHNTIFFCVCTERTSLGVKQLDAHLIIA